MLMVSNDRLSFNAAPKTKLDRGAFLLQVDCRIGQTREHPALPTK